MTNTQESSTMMEMFMKMLMERDEKHGIAQNEQMWAIIGMFLDGKPVCNSIPLEREIESGTIERLSDEEDESRDIDMRVEGALANVISEDVICEATFQDLSTTDTTIELDVVDVSSVNIVLEETFGEEVFPEEINNNDGSRMEDLVGDSSLDTISEEWFGKAARPEEVCCGAPETQMVDMALGIENSFGANGCRDMEDEFGLFGTSLAKKTETHHHQSKISLGEGRNRMCQLTQEKKGGIVLRILRRTLARKRIQG